MRESAIILIVGGTAVCGARASADVAEFAGIRLQRLLGDDSSFTSCETASVVKKPAPLKEIDTSL